ncbi:putative RNA-binding protein [Gammaproteobacteria bacterium]
MKVFVQRIPEGTSERELIRFVLEPFSKRSWFSFGARPEVLSCEILRVTDLDSHQVEYHGLLRISPDDAAAQVVKKLNGQCIGHCLVKVRQFFERAPADKRWREMSKEEFQQLENRRRPRVLIEKVHQIEATGLKQFARSYG